MAPGAIVLAVVLGILLLSWWAGTYNVLVRRRSLVWESWRQIDVELHRRHDLIPNLVQTVRGYAVRDREVVDAVERARTKARRSGATAMASPTELARQEHDLTRALGRLFALSEGCPPLRGDEDFRFLRRELADTENRIAAGCRFYNSHVRALNTSVRSFPGNVVARVFGVAPAEYFDADAGSDGSRPVRVQPPRVHSGRTSASASGRSSTPGAGGSCPAAGRSRLLRWFRT